MTAFLRSRSGFAIVFFLLIGAIVPTKVHGQAGTFEPALELAMQRGGTMAIAAADQIRARQSYLEARNAFVPMVNLGSGLAASYGFPLSLEGSAPAVIRVTTQSNLYNPA